MHTFGDSHCVIGWDSIFFLLNKRIVINIHYVGPKLMHSFGRDKLNLLDISKYNVKNGDIVCFCFGEIDCRCHVYKYRIEDYKKVIDKLVEDYINAIEANIRQYNNIITCIYNVVPPIQKLNTLENPDYPYLGSDKNRKDYVLYMNEKLLEKCKEKKFVFINIYDKYCDENGFLNKKLSDGSVHIKNPKYLEEFIIHNL
jgi:hypothetical protein